MTSEVPKKVPLVGDDTERKREESRKLRLVRMMSALGDFELANSAAAFLYEVDDDERYSKVELRKFRCFEHTAIVSYGRPFTIAKGRFPHLSQKMCGDPLSAEQGVLHERVMRLRNKLVAHTDVELMNFASKRHDIGPINGKPFHIFHSQHDEGLQFQSFLERVDFVNLIRTILHGLYEQILSETQSNPNALDMNVHYPVNAEDLLKGKHDKDA